MEPRGRTRAWIVALVPVVALTGALVVGAFVVDAALRPVTVESIETPVDTEPTPTPSLDIPPFIVQVEPIKNAPLREGVPLEAYIAGDTILDSTYLGTSGGWFAVGILAEDGTVCMMVSPVDRSDPNSAATTTCSGFDVFLADGLVYDGGSWDVRWLPTGSAVWQGLES